MGAGALRHPRLDAEEGPAEEAVKWKIVRSVSQAQLEYHSDGSLPPNATAQHIEFRELLNHPIAQAEIGKYAKNMGSMEFFMCWIDVVDFKSIPTADFRYSKGLHIFHKYIKKGAVLEIGSISPEEREGMKDLIAKSKKERGLIPATFYNNIQLRCFMDLYSNVFTRFKFTDECRLLMARLKGMYNVVRTSDFHYMRKLGEGGFGLVVHCRKKSTGKHHAIKIQTKKGLLDCYADDPSRVDFEKQAFAACQHPFVVSLDYAFQSEALAFIVLDLATGGDLNQALKAEGAGLEVKRVRFYSAEMVLALAHLHQMGLMYRDLKPSNLLLHEDGHIQLADLGGVVDAEGCTLGPRLEKDEMSGFFAPQRPTPAPRAESDGRSTEARRRMSIMGTFGYMAPEMVIMLNQARHEKKGYSNSVDWWSLGATMFKLATGYRPFTEASVSQVFNYDFGLIRECRELAEYTVLFQDIPFPHHMHPALRDIISRLLDVNPESRLGGGPRGAAEIREHDFFNDIDWSLLEQKHLVPPFIPHTKSLDESPQYASFEACMSALGKNAWLNELPDPNLQKYFCAWDYVSPHTQRVELGVTREMEQYDTKFKVRQLLGDSMVHQKSSVERVRSSSVFL